MNRETPSPLSHPSDRPALRTFSNDLQRRILEAAEHAHVDSLQSVEVRSAGNGLRVEWQGGPDSGLDFMRLAETHGIAAARLRVNSGRWVMEARPEAPRARSTSPAPLRDPFDARSRFPTPVAAETQKIRERTERARRKREESERSAAAAAENDRRLEQRKSELSAALTISALLNNGREPVAIVEIMEAGRRRTVSLRRGETVMGARVADLDEKNGLVQLEIDGQTRVTLTLSGGRRP